MAFTVTATQGGSTAAFTALRVKVLTGAAVAASQTGATNTQHQASGANQLSITTTVTGSQVYAAMWIVNASTFTANGNTTLIDNAHNTDGLTKGTGRTTSATGTPGAITIGATSPTTTGSSIALLEVLPNGTITEDASGPAWADNNGVSATTASFTPPNGSLLVAVVTSNGGAGTTTMALSDTSGLGISWTEKAKINGTGLAYAGVWIADMPAGNASVSGVVAPLALAAPAGTLNADGTILGAPVAPLALNAPAGTTASNPVPGLTSGLTLAAFPGLVTGGTGFVLDDDDPPWHVRRHR